MVLGGRHLVGIFMVLVVLFAGVFSLGYLLGRNQGVQLSASAASTPALPKEVPEKPEPASGTAAAGKSPAADWDFYHAGEPGQPSERLTPQPKPVAAASPIAPAPVAAVPARRAPLKTVAAKSSGSENAALIPRGASVLQVAALARQGDALALAQALQQKKFPAFVLNPTTDHYYRVQVGPYRDAQAANAAQKRLEDKGFKTIVKR
jgi:hypothetical protein